MTSTINVTITTLISNSSDALSTALSVIAILLLIVLLIEKELVRAAGGVRVRTWMQALDIAIVPLLVAFSCIIAMRVADMLH